MMSSESNHHTAGLGWPWINTTDPSSVSLAEYRWWYVEHGSMVGPNITDCSLEEEMNKVLLRDHCKQLYHDTSQKTGVGLLRKSRHSVRIVMSSTIKSHLKISSDFNNMNFIVEQNELIAGDDQRMVRGTQQVLSRRVLYWHYLT